MRYIDVRQKTDEELKKIIKHGKEAKKVVERRLVELLTKTWDMRDAERRLERLLKDARIELGRRRAETCGALKQNRDDWGDIYYSCEARDIQCNFFRLPEYLYIKYCSECKWTPEQAKVRKVMIKINKRNRNG